MAAASFLPSKYHNNLSVAHPKQKHTQKRILGAEFVLAKLTHYKATRVCICVIFAISLSSTPTSNLTHVLSILPLKRILSSSFSFHLYFHFLEQATIFSHLHSCNHFNCSVFIHSYMSPIIL